MAVTLAMSWIDESWEIAWRAVYLIAGGLSTTTSTSDLLKSALSENDQENSSCLFCGACQKILEDIGWWKIFLLRLEHLSRASCKCP